MRALVRRRMLLRTEKLKLTQLHGFSFVVDTAELYGRNIERNYFVESMELTRFKSLLKKEDIVADVGAHCGIYSITSSRVVGNSGKVFAFEPNEKTRRLLLHNIFLNGRKNIEVVSDAVSDKSGTAIFHQNAESGLSGLGKTKRGFTVNSCNVKTVTLDEFFSKRNIHHLNALKVDVEGYEGHVLFGAKNLLKNSQSIIVLCELAEKNYTALNFSVLGVFDYMKSLGFLSEHIANDNYLFTRPR